MIKVNDIVRFLNDVGGGRVTRIEDKTVYVEDEDGFERPAIARDLVVVGEAGTKASSYERPLDIKSKLVEPDEPAKRNEPVQPLEPVVETPEGEKLNILLAYEPKEIKHLNTTTFYASLVNDSNYFLYFAYMTRGDRDLQWTTRFHGIAEPNYIVELDEVGHKDLGDMTHVAVQYIAFKQGKEFALKNPALVHRKLDFTKFYKLHCFRSTPYFDTPVISLEITHNDLPSKEMRIDSSALEAAMKKQKAEERPQRKAISQPNERHRSEPIIQDLHIAELIDNLAGMSKADILNYQIDKFHEVMRAHLKHTGQRIVFIHGKGEGVLRQAIMRELKRHYPYCEAQDASFQEYGFGATQITIHHKNK
ncbi:MAG: DUF2027 domain-containing protein [Muribaculaceae bacterium]|nr:DUF2027 domain-containing protein [Muribaculaceae bacterium]